MKLSTKKNILKAGFTTYCLILLFGFIAHLFVSFNNSDFYENCFRKWTFSDFIINYEGGFVRRGLLGELLLFIYNNTGADISMMIHLFIIITTLVLIILTITIFIRKKLSLFILPTAMLLGCLATHKTPSFRRDAFMLLVIFLIFYVYREYVKKKSTIYYVLFSFLSIIIILTHEASFFCFAPFIFVHRYISTTNANVIKKFIRTFAFLLPIIIAMGSVCICKGDEETANLIWDSACPYFNEKFGTGIPIGEGVQALTWETIPTIKFHLNSNYFDTIPYTSIPRIFAWFLIFPTIFYICANVNRVKLFNYESEPAHSQFLTTALIVQFISLLPMFTVLSCDLGRIVLYWSISSFFIYALFEDKSNVLKMPVITHLSSKINRIFNGKILANKYIYLFCVLTAICPFVCFPIPTALYTSIIGHIYRVIHLIINIIGSHL